MGVQRFLDIDLEATPRLSELKVEWLFIKKTQKNIFRPLQISFIPDY